MLHSRSSSASLARFVTGSLLSALLLPASLSSQPAPKGLQVLSATLDPEAHEVTVQLQSSTSKTVVAYSLTIQSLDSAQALIGSREVEFDYVGPEPNSGAKNFIAPGGTGVATLSVAPDVQFARVSVFALVFEDLTLEGDAGWIFTGRRRRAEATHLALKHLEVFRATREENRKVLARLHGLGLNPPEEALSKEHWEAIQRDVEAKAAWWDAHKWGKGEKGQPI